LGAACSFAEDNLADVRAVWDMSLAKVINDADLILIGPPGRIWNAEGNYPFHIANEQTVDRIVEVQVKEILASRWSRGDTEMRLSGKDRTQQGLFFLKFPHSSASSQPTLMPGADYLLFLKLYDLSADDAKKMGVESRRTFAPSGDWRGGWRLAPWIPPRPDDPRLKNYVPGRLEANILNANFGITEVKDLIEATRRFSRCLAAQNKHSREELQTLAASKDQFYSRTAQEFLPSLEKTRRFEYVAPVVSPEKE
jgi:hypothetical protein